MSDIISTLLSVLYGLWLLGLLLWGYLTVGAAKHARQAEAYGLDSSRYRSMSDRFRPYRWKALGLLLFVFAVFVFVDANFYPDEPRFFPFGSD